MGVILGKSKAIVPRGTREIRHAGSPEKRAIEMTRKIAKSFGLQSGKMKPGKIMFR